MWNMRKIYKCSKNVFERNHNMALLDDNTGEARLDEVQAIYREFGFPANVFVLRKFMKGTKERRKIFLGIDWNDETYIKEKVIPKLSDRKWLQSLPPNTVGGHLGNLLKDWSLEELYDKRFKADENGAFLIKSNFASEIRSNTSRHMFLTHDIWHVLFRYDTSLFGEGLIQKISYHAIGSWAMNYIAFVVALKIAWRTKSLLPFKVLKEADKLGKAVDKKNLVANSPLSFLERDIAEVRKEFNIGVPTEYLKWIKKYPDSYKGDNIHPQYIDKEWHEANSI